MRWRWSQVITRSDPLDLVAHHDRLSVHTDHRPPRTKRLTTSGQFGRAACHRAMLYAELSKQQVSDGYLAIRVPLTRVISLIRVIPFTRVIPPILFSCLALTNLLEPTIIRLCSGCPRSPGWLGHHSIQLACFVLDSCLWSSLSDGFTINSPTSVDLHWRCSACCKHGAGHWASTKTSR